MKQSRSLPFADACLALQRQMELAAGEALAADAAAQDLRWAFAAGRIEVLDHAQRRIDLDGQHAEFRVLYEQPGSLLGMYGESISLAALNEWLASEGRSYRVDAPVESHVSHASPSDDPFDDRRRRRLQRFRELGGVLKRAGASWHVEGTRGALARLVREEKESCQSRSDRSDIKKEIMKAAEDELRSQLRS